MSHSLFSETPETYSLQRSGMVSVSTLITTTLFCLQAFQRPYPRKVITVNKGDVFLDLHVQPKSKRAGIRGVHDGRLKIAVTEPAEDGKANRAVLATVADMLGVPPRTVTLVAGASSRQKRIRVVGMSVDVARRRVDKVLDELE